MNLRFILSFSLLFLLMACSDSEPITLDTPVDCQPQNFVATHDGLGWSSAEISSICSLWLGNLPDLPPDPTNHVADDPAAAQLGQRIFFDTAFSADNTIACATCHKPELNFTDGMPLPIGGGPRKTPTIVGTAYNTWFFWDGRADSQWSQALGPLESSSEHKGNRAQ
ncbi:MAG TPA: hypothetical protein ENJ56_00750, partial [Anaerolineae bacterium]|nr:hypothetical protein [Anaerolineae bacterium]